MAEQPAAQHPNILIIMTDQHRHDLLTCAGRDLVPTPNIDRIADAGVRFTDAYCPYPVCVASRMSFLTGLYAHSTGAINNTDRLDWRFRTMAHHFADSGYLTSLVGKMHFNDAHKHGFEYYLSINDWLMYLGPKAQHYANEIGNHPISPHFYDTMIDDGAGLPDIADLWDGPSPWVGNVERFTFDDMASRLAPEDHLDMFVARESAKFMQRYREQPFLLVASFMKPHTPFFPPRAWADMYPVEQMTLPPVGDISGYPPHIQERIQGIQEQPEKGRRAHRAGYLGNLAFVDTCVGYLYQALLDLGLQDNTIVVFTSDHGEMDGDHGLFQKFCLFDPSVRVPLIVSQPGRLPQGQVSNALVQNFALYPTLAELAGLPPPSRTTLNPVPGAPATLDAHSFADLVRNPQAEGPPAAFSEYALRSGVPQYMVRTRRYKYILNHGSIDELYDLDEDPGENVNRIDDPTLSAQLSALRSRLTGWYDPERNQYRGSGAHQPAATFWRR